MGFISRKIFPACGNMCVCCPALRSRSRQPVKRYKKLLAEIFPKSLDGSPNERKIIKLCEYAAKNPFRIPKIAKYLEERCHKELRCEHIKFINVVAETYNKLLGICKEQIVYFAASLLNMVTELLDNPKHDILRILGCQTLTKFIYNQTDGTYTHNIEKLVHKICSLARESGYEHQTICLRASSLQCLSAMVWFMAEISHVFDDFEEIVHVTLDNYGPSCQNEHDDNSGEAHHNWVDEVVRCEGRGGANSGCDISPSCMVMRPRIERKDSNLLTREEIETPKVWAQICIQRMIDLAKEGTTMRRVLDPMFVYFDTRRQWHTRQGLAFNVLSDMSYLVETTGNQHFIVAAVIRHADHKNVAHDPEFKSLVIQVATALTRQIRLGGAMLAEVGFVSDLCRHLRKCLQATIEPVGEEESNVNISLRNSIEDCLLEIAKGIGDAQSLCDIMAMTLEKLPSVGVAAKATIASLLILAHTVALSSVSLRIQQGFPEALFVHLLKAMLHPDVETRVGAHQIFSILLTANPNSLKPDVYSLRSGFTYEQRRWHPDNASASNSITALLKKLRNGKDGIKAEKHANIMQDESKERDVSDKHAWVPKSSPNFYKINSIIDKTAGSSSLTEGEPCILKLSEDQISQLLSAFWIQANLPDNMPSNIEAIAHSFSLALISSRLKNLNGNLLVRFFQLPLSLQSISLDASNGMLPPTCQRAVLILSTGMLMFAAKIFQISDLIDLLKSLVPNDVDSYMGISDELQVYVKPLANLQGYGSAPDNNAVVSLLFEIQPKIIASHKVVLDTLVQSLSSITQLDADDIAEQLSAAFTPDDAFMFAPPSILVLDHVHMVSDSKDSLSFDGELPSSSLVDDDAVSESSVSDLARFIPRVPASPCVSHIINIGQLMESALEVAGQVAGTSVSTSPLPYSAMASQCEAFGAGTRKKLTNWLVHDNHCARSAETPHLPAILANGHLENMKITSDGGAVHGGALAMDPWLAMRLPPASPFDNFLRAAQYQRESDGSYYV